MVLCAEQIIEARSRRRIEPSADWILLGVPAWNEEKSLALWISEIPESLQGVVIIPVLVSDGSSDRTAEVAETAQWIVLRKEKNQGLAHSMAVLFELAQAVQAPALVTMDGDGQHGPSELPRFLEAWKSGGQLVTGSRYLGGTVRQSVVRTRGLQVISGILGLLLGRRILDPACGYRLYAAETFRAMKITHRRHYAAETLIRGVLAGLRVKEVPVTIQSRISGHSKQGMTLVYGLRFTWVLLRSWWLARRDLKSVQRGG